jgi:putative transposase
VLFFIELDSRRVHLAGCTANPSGTWVTQQVRNLSWSLAERPAPLRFLIHDRDSMFAGGFDDVFRSGGLEIVRTRSGHRRRTPSPSASSAPSAPSCLDWLLIVGRRQLEHVLRVFISTTAIAHTEHSASRRPTENDGLYTSPAQTKRKRIRRRDRLGGLIHEYSLAA